MRIARTLSCLLLLALIGAPARAGEPITVAGTRVSSAQPERIARSEALLGTADSFRTATTARRVLAEGAELSSAGRLVANPTPSGTSEGGALACPYQLASMPGSCLLATELVEHLALKGPVHGDLQLEGRILEIDGIRYVVLTAYQPGKA
jgi:hypothetical protein